MPEEKIGFLAEAAREKNDVGLLGMVDERMATELCAGAKQTGEFTLVEGGKLNVHRGAL